MSTGAKQCHGPLLSTYYLSVCLSLLVHLAPSASCSISLCTVVWTLGRQKQVMCVSLSILISVLHFLSIPPTYPLTHGLPPGTLTRQRWQVAPSPVPAEFMVPMVVLWSVSRPPPPPSRELWSRGIFFCEQGQVWMLEGQRERGKEW